GTNLGQDDVFVRFRGRFIGLAIGLLLFGTFYVFKVMSDRYTFKPEKLFTDTFDENISSITDFKSGGEISGSHDTWIYFKLTREAVLKGKDDFKGGDQAEVARRWFIKILPDSQGLQPQSIENLKLRSKVDNSQDHIYHHWYLYNWRTDEHYYRDWGF
ncbi:MAG: hypothetical protein K8F91_05385, partial [Candidatus Obscuribacterales bacterium]|nr:hypothetical protein [Candidatus Obscuribacterales bacterium]